MVVRKKIEEVNLGAEYALSRRQSWLRRPFLSADAQLNPSVMGLAWERRVTFGPKPAENETLGDDWEENGRRRKEKGPGGSWGARLELPLISEQTLP